MGGYLALRDSRAGIVRLGSGHHQQPHGVDRGRPRAGALKEPCEVEIVTDSEYVKNGITQWIAK